MSAGRQFVLDANVFIEAHQTYYAFDICPAFWVAPTRQHVARRVCSIDKIKAELEALNDELKVWAKDKAPSTFFKETADKKVSDSFSAMVNWVQNEQQFTAEAKVEFASVADGWIVAYAKANSLDVVTHEVYAPDIRNKVKIPNVCVEFGVSYCNTFEMIRELKEQFVLKARRRTR